MIWLWNVSHRLLCCWMPCPQRGSAVLGGSRIFKRHIRGEEAGDWECAFEIYSWSLLLFLLPIQQEVTNLYPWVLLLNGGRSGSHELKPFENINKVNLSPLRSFWEALDHATIRHTENLFLFLAQDLVCYTYGRWLGCFRKRSKKENTSNPVTFQRIQ